MEGLVNQHLDALKDRPFPQHQAEYTHPQTGHVMSMAEAVGHHGRESTHRRRNSTEGDLALITGIAKPTVALAPSTGSNPFDEERHRGREGASVRGGRWVRVSVQAEHLEGLYPSCPNLRLGSQAVREALRTAAPPSQERYAR